MKGKIKQNEYCKKNKLNTQQIRRYKIAGMPFDKVGTSVWLDEKVCDQWILDNVQVNKKENNDGKKYNEQRARLTKLQADKQEIDNDLRLKELIEMSKVNEALTKSFLEIKKIIESVEMEIYNSCPDLPPDAIDIIKLRHAEALNRFSEIKI